MTAAMKCRSTAHNNEHNGCNSDQAIQQWHPDQAELNEAAKISTATLRAMIKSGKPKGWTRRA